MEAGTGSTCQKRKWPHPPLMAGSRKPVLPGLMGGKGEGGGNGGKKSGGKGKTLGGFSYSVVVTSF